MTAVEIRHHHDVSPQTIEEHNSKRIRGLEPWQAGMALAYMTGYMLDDDTYQRALGQYLDRSNVPV
jgi:hypothetical protein